MSPSAVAGRSDDEPSTSENFDLEKTADEAKSLIEKIIKDVGQKSATRQLIFGSASGWYVNYLHEIPCTFVFEIKRLFFVRYLQGNWFCYDEIR